MPCPFQLSKDTHGFVGADLSQLCMEAALRCIREQMHTIDVDSDKIPVVSSVQVEYSMLLFFFFFVQESDRREHVHQ